VIAPTALGHGASSPVDSLSFAGLAGAVLELLDDLGVPRTHVVGSSMGGATALYLATRFPERIDRLVLYRTNFRTGERGQAALEAMTHAQTWRQWGLEKQMREQHLPQGGPEAWVEVTKKVIAMVRSEKTGELAHPEDLGRILAPTFLICGDRDPLVPLGDALMMYEKIPDAALWIVPDASHVLQVEGLRRDSFPAEILAFLRKERN
jgi:pimeloyl-ACP methyl ester carboxylesterase